MLKKGFVNLKDVDLIEFTFNDVLGPYLTPGEIDSRAKIKQIHYLKLVTRLLRDYAQDQESKDAKLITEKAIKNIKIRIGELTKM